MVILITGASHTGKTVLAKKLMQDLSFPYFSMDHLKMGLIRSKQTDLTPMSSLEDLTGYLWPILREMIKTVIENKQDLILEGCYIPADWEQDFSPEYRQQIRFLCLTMTDRYIRDHFEEIKSHARDAEHRLEDSGLTAKWLLQENSFFHQRFSSGQILIDKDYIRDMKQGVTQCLKG